MTFVDLLAVLRSRGWIHRVWIEGINEFGRTDNLLLLLRTGETWRLAYYERGHADPMAEDLDEESACAAVLKALAPVTGRPASPAASLDLRDSARKDMSTWTL